MLVNYSEIIRRTLRPELEKIWSSFIATLYDTVSPIYLTKTVTTANAQRNERSGKHLIDAACPNLTGILPFRKKAMEMRGNRKHKRGLK